MSGSEPPVGLVHDYLLVMRGAERTFAAIAACWPTAPISTTLFDPTAVAPLAARDIRTSFLQRTGVRQPGFRRLLPLYPLAVQTLPVSGTELVVSSSSAFAHGVRVRPGAQHVCYCYTPFRYAWHERGTALAEVPWAARPALDLMLSVIRRWDLHAAAGVDHYIAISQVAQERIKRSYGRDAPIVYPPVDLDRFVARAGDDRVLVVCELVAHKRVEIALEGIVAAGRPGVVVGDGPERLRLQARFPGVRFAGRVSDVELAALYAEVGAVVVPSFEEFGIVAVEAQASGTPVVAPRAGGAAETVVHDSTGVLLDDVTPRTVALALDRQAVKDPDLVALRSQAERFGVAAFQQRLIETIEERTGGPSHATWPQG